MILFALPKLAGRLLAVAPAVAILLVVHPPAAAAQDARAVVTFVGAAGMAAAAANVPPAMRTARLRRLFHEYFAVNRIAEFALGPYRRIATPAQENEYFRLYEEYSVQTYAQQLAYYGSAPFRVIASGPYGGETVVTSEIVRPDGGRIAVNWYLIERHGRYKIDDLSIAGISMKNKQ